ncbi:Trk family potassium uptake protein [Candidatus Woesearchaeota archaeon]|nr:Trk family potassium uptake protein [Candidatus Woesearchaeota archaeon]
MEPERNVGEPVRLFSSRFDKPLLKKRVSPIKLIITGFFFIILIGAFLLQSSFALKPGKSITFFQAIFTATSATTVTGLVVVDTGNTFSLIGYLIILFLIHLGGLGYMTVLSFFFLTGNNMPLKQGIFMQEQLNLPSLGDIVSFGRKVLALVIIFEGLGMFMLSIVWSFYFGIKKGVFYGIFHAISAFNNAGFDIMGNFQSLTAFATNPIINITIMLLIIAGGLGFFVLTELLQLWRKEITVMSLHAKIVVIMSFFLIIIGTLGILFFERTNEHTLQPLSIPSKILAASFQSISARTTGFNTIDISKLTLPSTLVLDFLMFIGGSPGSTAGGIKTTTAALAFATILSFILQKPHTEILNRRINDEIIQKVFVILLVSIVIIFGATFLISSHEGATLKASLFEVISAFSTVGLSTGLTTQASVYSQTILILLMFIGRMGPLSFILLISKTHKSKVQLPEEGVAVG